MRLIPVSQKVLLYSAWVDSGEYLAAAARLVAQCQAEVFGIACVRFEQNRRYVNMQCVMSCDTCSVSPFVVCISPWYVVTVAFTETGKHLPSYCTSLYSAVY